MGKYGAKWLNNKKQGSVKFSQSSLKSFSNTYYITAFFQLGNKMFGQVFGIPMGLDPALFFVYHFP